MKRILITGANPYNANKGVSALAYSTMCMIDDILSTENIDYELCIYNHEFRKTFDWIETPTKKIHFQNVYPSDMLSIKSFFNTLFSKWRLYNLREFLKSDIILNITAGDSFSDIYGNANFFSQNQINRLARLFSKKVLFLPQTYGPFLEKSMAEKAAIRSLRNAIGIMSRDKESTEYLEGLGFENIVDSIDMAFYLPFKSQYEKHTGIHVGINVSKTLWERCKEHNFELQIDYPMSIRHIIGDLLKKGYKVHLISHVVDSRNVDDDEYSLAYNLWKEFHHKNLLISPFFFSPIEAKNYIASMDIFIGSRMHACIGAFSSNTPVLLLGYSRKFSGLFEKTLGYCYNVDLSKDWGSNYITDKIDEMIEKRTLIRQQIEDINKVIVRNKIKDLKSRLKIVLS